MKKTWTPKSPAPSNFLTTIAEEICNSKEKDCRPLWEDAISAARSGDTGISPRNGFLHTLYEDCQDLEEDRVLSFINALPKPKKKLLMAHLGSDNGCTIFSLALLSGHRRVVRALLSAGYNPNFEDGFALDRPLYYALFRFNEEMVELLLQKGAKLDGLNDNGNTPLMSVCERGVCSPEALKYMLEKGSSMEVVNHSAMSLPDIIESGDCGWLKSTFASCLANTAADRIKAATVAGSSSPRARRI